MRKILAETQTSDTARKAMESFHSEVVAEAEKAVKENDWVVIGMAQNPFVKKARGFLTEKSISFHYIEHGSYLSKWRERLAVKLWSGWPTFPQIFHKGRLIGGFQDLQNYLNSKTS